MTRSLIESAVTTKSARKALKAGVHWRRIDAEIHLGYRKGRRGGVWLVRWRNGAGYKQAPLGTADDAIGAGTLDFEAALKAARAHVQAARLEAMAAVDGPVLTVRSAVEAYVMSRDVRASKRAGRQIRSDASQRLARYVLGQPSRGKRKEVTPAPIADIALHILTETDLLTWREQLPELMKSTTRQRLVNDVKAALNGSYAANRMRLPAALPAAIKHGLRAIDREDAEPVARDNQILPDADVGRIVQAAREIDLEQSWEGDLFRLVVVLASTGARFSQVTRMTVGDVQRASGRLMVPPSRKGKGTKAATAIAIPVGMDVLDALLPATTGRKTGETLLERWRFEQVGPAKWIRTRRGAWLASAEMARPWAEIRRRAQLTADIVPYALRHSSIVRGIRSNLPLRLVAGLHDTSTQMIERHYSRWIVDGLEEIARAAVVSIVPPLKGATVTQLRR
jgi:integrase